MAEHIVYQGTKTVGGGRPGARERMRRVQGLGTRTEGGGHDSASDSEGGSHATAADERLRMATLAPESSAIWRAQDALDGQGRVPAHAEVLKRQCEAAARKRQRRGLPHLPVETNAARAIGLNTDRRNSPAYTLRKSWTARPHTHSPTNPDQPRAGSPECLLEKPVREQRKGCVPQARPSLPDLGERRLPKRACRSAHMSGVDALTRLCVTPSCSPKVKQSWRLGYLESEVRAPHQPSAMYTASSSSVPARPAPSLCATKGTRNQEGNVSFRPAQATAEAKFARWRSRSNVAQMTGKVMTQCRSVTWPTQSREQAWWVIHLMA